MTWVAAREWTDDDGLRLVSLGGALAGFAGAVAVGGNGFIAAFVCGIGLHLVMGRNAGRNAELAEDVGQIGASATFVIFGAVMVVPAFGAFGWEVTLCAVATLTLGRMIPVRLAMIGTGLRNPTVAFMGWFGPRGLASMLFGLLLVAERGPEVDQLFSIITLVIFASVVLHGMTAAPGARVYSQWFTQHGQPEMAESASVPETRVRGARRGPASSHPASPPD
jgi:NhaP-type Na+/H+ or K+/H+ antiporter